MLQLRHEWLQRIKDVEREYILVRFSTDYLLAVAEQDPSILAGRFRPRAIRNAAMRLEGTYIIRLFAEFETGLRLYWKALRGRRSPSRTSDLLDGIAARRRVPDVDLTNAQDVRDDRNHLVHARESMVDPIAMADVRRSLCVYFSFLPPQW